MLHLLKQQKSDPIRSCQTGKCKHYAIQNCNCFQVIADVILLIESWDYRQYFLHDLKIPSVSINSFTDASFKYPAIIVQILFQNSATLSDKSLQLRTL